MANEPYYDLSIPFVPQPRPTLLLTTVDNQYASLPSTAATVPRTRSPTKSPFDPRPCSGSTGYDPSPVDSTSSGVVCSPELLAHTDAANVAPGFAATSDNAAPTTLDSSREHQPLLTLEAEAAVAQEAEDSKTSTLQYFLIGILFAGLVIAAILATANAPGGPLAPHDLLPEEERRPVRHRPRSSYDVPKDVQDQELLVVVPSAAQQLQPVVGESSRMNKTRNGLGNTTGVRSAERKKPAQHSGQPESATAERYVGEECRRYYYTYCSHPVPLFHYDPELRVCVPTSDGGSQLCNHGSNRFSSWEHCRENCLKPDRVSKRCMENTLFLPCTRQDVMGTFWYFDGRACVTWDFPRGNCPQSHRGVYETFRDCSRQCEGKQGQNRADPTHCGIPEPGACGLKHLKYAYFADMQAEGSARCANASRTSLVARRCLVGSNQFHSLEACQGACMD
ncbi:hypothetical protein MTO96_051288 [Rhipicephalus appendiculatus]